LLGGPRVRGEPGGLVQSGLTAVPVVELPGVAGSPGQRRPAGRRASSHRDRRTATVDSLTRQ